MRNIVLVTISVLLSTMQELTHSFGVVLILDLMIESPPHFKYTNAQGFSLQFVFLFKIFFISLMPFSISKYLC